MYGHNFFLLKHSNVPTIDNGTRTIDILFKYSPRLDTNELR